MRSPDGAGDIYTVPRNTRLDVGTMFVMIGLWTFIHGLTISATRANELSGIASVQTSLSAQSVQVAEPVGLHIVVTARSGAKVLFPAKSSQLGDFEAINYQDMLDIPAVDSPQFRTWTRTVQLESLVTGNLLVPSLEISVTADGVSETLRTQALPIEIASVLSEAEDPTQFRDIVSVVDVPTLAGTNWPVFCWSLAGVVAIALIAGTALWIVQRKKWITPESWATRKLEHLSRSPELQTGDSRSVLQNLAAILRTFVEMKFQIAATVTSSHEFMQLAELQLNQATATEYGKLFVLADEAKFAGRHLAQSELAQAIDRAKALIQHSAAGNPVASSAQATAGVA